MFSTIKYSTLSHTRITLTAKTNLNLVLALNERQSHFRCIEVSRCALNDRGLQVFLNYLERQNPTMECINIADNPGRIHLAKFPITMSRFSQIRKLDLSRVTSTCGTEALIEPEIMLTWRLEEVILTGIPVSNSIPLIWCVVIIWIYAMFLSSSSQRGNLSCCGSLLWFLNRSTR